MLETSGLSVAFGEGFAVRDVSLSIAAGEWVMLIGPNGAGKSTLLSAIAQCVPYQGTVRLDGCDARRWKPRAFARTLGVLAQVHAVAYAFTVEELVSMGRYAHTRGFLHSQDAGGREAVRRALAATGLETMRGRNIQTLSGGELQRVFLAQVLAQEPRVLLLDEPANHLDLMFQKQFFELIDDWLRSGDRCVISVVHDLSLAMRFGTRAVLMERGTVAADGSAENVLSCAALQRAYGMDVTQWMAETGRRWQTLAARSQDERHARTG